MYNKINESTSKITPTTAAFKDVFCVLMLLTVPLELLINIPVVSRFANFTESIEILAQVGFVFLLLGIVGSFIASGIGCLWGAINKDLVCSNTTAKFTRAYAILMLVFVSVRGLKLWLSNMDGVFAPLVSLNSYVWITFSVIIFLVLIYLKDLALPLFGLWWRFASLLMLIVLICCLITGAKNNKPDEMAQSPVMKSVPGKKTPNVILVTVDTLSAEHMSIYEYLRETTPNLSKFAAQSTVFDKFYANSNFTTAGIQSLISGTRPWTSRVFWVTDKPNDNTSKFNILASFHENGFKTVAVVTNNWASPLRLRSSSYLDKLEHSNPWANVCPIDPNNFLLEKFNPIASQIILSVGWYSRIRDALVDLFTSVGWCPSSGWYNPDDALQMGISNLIEMDERSPVFLWVHLTPPHDPYAPPPPWVGKFDSRMQARKITDSSPLYHNILPENFKRQVNRLEGRYDEAILYVDDSIGRFLGELKRIGRYDNSVIIISADHGESFGHNYGGHGGPELYEDIIRIPLLIKIPRQKIGLRSKQLCEQADILPTLEELVGIKTSSSLIEGRSLAPILIGNAESLPVKPVYSMNYSTQNAAYPINGGSIAMIDGNYKLHVYLKKGADSSVMAEKIRLFNIAEDPKELDDLSDTKQGIARRMLDSILKEVAVHSLPPK